MKPTLIIDEEKIGFKQTFEFEMDKNGHPIKLGDGSFGIVYAAFSRSKRYAIKLFYDDSRQHKFEDGLVINEEVLKAFREINSYSENNEKCQRIKQLSWNYH